MLVNHSTLLLLIQDLIRVCESQHVIIFNAEFNLGFLKSNRIVRYLEYRKYIETGQFIE